MKVFCTQYISFITEMLTSQKRTSDLAYLKSLNTPAPSVHAVVPALAPSSALPRSFLGFQWQPSLKNETTGIMTGKTNSFTLQYDIVK